MVLSTILFFLENIHKIWRIEYLILFLIMRIIMAKFITATQRHTHGMSKMLHIYR